MGWEINVTEIISRPEDSQYGTISAYADLHKPCRISPWFPDPGIELMNSVEAYGQQGADNIMTSY